MLTEMLYFEPRCRICGECEAIPLIRERVAEALRRRAPIVLYSPCHDCEWEASPAERRALAQLVQAPRLEEGEQLFGTPFLPFALAGATGPGSASG